MKQKPFLEEFNLEIHKLIYDNVNDLSKVAALNSPIYYGVIKYFVDELLKEAELQKKEEFYLMEIRRLWILHIFFLDSVRYIYDLRKFKKLPRPKEFIDRTLPAYIELSFSL